MAINNKIMMTLSPITKIYKNNDSILSLEDFIKHFYLQNNLLKEFIKRYLIKSSGNLCDLYIINKEFDQWIPQSGKYDQRMLKEFLKCHSLIEQWFIRQGLSIVHHNGTIYIENYILDINTKANDIIWKYRDFSTNYLIVNNRSGISIQHKKKIS